MSTIVKQQMQTIQTKEVLLHSGALQQLFDVCAAADLVEGFVETVIDADIIQDSTSRLAVEMVDDEA